MIFYIFFKCEFCVNFITNQNKKLYHKLIHSKNIFKHILKYYVVNDEIIPTSQIMLKIFVQQS